LVYRNLDTEGKLNDFKINSGLSIPGRNDSQGGAGGGGGVGRPACGYFLPSGESLEMRREELLEHAAWLMADGGAA